MILNIITPAIVAAIVSLMINWLVTINRNNKKKNALEYFLNTTIRQSADAMKIESKKAKKIVNELKEGNLEIDTFPAFSSDVIREFSYSDLYDLYGKKIREIYLLRGRVEAINDRMLPNFIVRECYNNAKELMKEYYKTPEEKTENGFVQKKPTQDQFIKSDQFRKKTTDLALSKKPKVPPHNL